MTSLILLISDTPSSASIPRNPVIASGVSFSYALTTFSGSFPSSIASCSVLEELVTRMGFEAICTAKSAPHTCRPP